MFGHVEKGFLGDTIEGFLDGGGEWAKSVAADGDTAGIAQSRVSVPAHSLSEPMLLQRFELALRVLKPEPRGGSFGRPEFGEQCAHLA